MTAKQFLLLLGAVFLIALNAALTVEAYGATRDVTTHVCKTNAEVAFRWASKLRDESGLTLEVAAVSLIPQDFEGMPDELIHMVLAHTKKGLELVWESKPKKTPAAVSKAFFEWCIRSETVPALQGLTDS